MKTMASPGIVFYLSCLFLGKMVLMSDSKVSSSLREETRFISADVGDKVTLQCSHRSGVPVRIYWYKQTLGKKPWLVSSFFKYDMNDSLHNEFKNNPRFTLDTEDSKNHLTITDLRVSDSATYYCIYYSYALKFSESVTVSVKGSGLNIKAWVHQSASETVQPGDSVTLSCTVHTGTCDGGHSVYWFKNQEEESHPELMYTHGGRNDQCERKPDTQTHTCIYHLPMKSLNLSHAGTYYCAVVSCGRILFGDGTKLDFQGEVTSLVLVYFLSGALTFTTILSVLLTFLLYKKNKMNSHQSSESQARFVASSTTHAEGNQDEDSLHYAALSVKQPKRSREQRSNMEDECVYSSVNK